ncbi:nickel pincer cofactor biosynthesis protein LarC [Enterococcus sp. CSURQ0835]|uniref:nickel pincer cofactor biosynthesis protein LarC n=1 Tax=Enterococcus sp. CSURQ0835 TaxID=2681394 RepID=UPI0013575AD1|nr:nickel pincer cofactor biosynthesis protein LarC [Enterococcus sp. CSURQ0835]
MKNLYLEPFSGLSGDMLNGLLLDLGGDLALMEQELNKLSVKGFHLHAKRIEKSSIYGTDFDVHLTAGSAEKDHGIKGDFADSHAEHPSEMTHEHHHHHAEQLHDHSHSHGHARNLQDILQLIEQSDLSQTVKQHSTNVFTDIAKAEAAVHQMPLDQIHFHEVGALDSIVDVIGFFILWEQLDLQHVYATPVTEGSGTITVAHGVMPVPVPAVMQLRKNSQIPIQQDFEIKTELVTPTGLAIFKELAPRFTKPLGTIEKVGYGFGKRETGKFNALRGSLLSATHSNQIVQATGDQVLQIETNIDDQTPEQLGYVMDVLLDQGALDVFYTSIQMKKNRSGILLTVLTTPDQKEFFTKLLFKHTSTIGMRFATLDRTIMKRSFEVVKTTYGAVHIKVNTYQGITKKTIEYQDCEQIAKEHDLAIADVYRLVEAAIK